MQEIAKRLQISTATVSRSLRDDPLVHPETRARVTQLAAAAGYQAKARRSRNRKIADDTIEVPESPSRPDSHNLLGVVLADSAPVYRHGNFMRMLQGITSECDAMGIMSSLFFVQSDAAELASPGFPMPDPVVDGRCQAVVVSGRYSEAILRQLPKQIPAIVLARRFDEYPSDAVLADNAAGITALVRRLAAFGHRKLAFVDDIAPASFIFERYTGFLGGCEECGITPADHIRIGKEAYSGTGYEARIRPEFVEGVLRTHGTTGFVCANDWTAYCWLAALEQLGITAPDCVSVTGFDNDPMPLFATPSYEQRLCTIDPNFVEMGRRAVRFAAERTAKPAVHPLRLTVQGRLIEGATTGPVVSR